MRRHRVHPKAELELHAASDFYEAERPGYGDLFDEEYERHLRRALRLFKSGVRVKLSRPMKHEVRRFGFNRFPYSLVVADVRGMFVVVAVAHAKREPGYWRERVR
jgi:toxin ParE1/3/4